MRRTLAWSKSRAAAGNHEHNHETLSGALVLFVAFARVGQFGSALLSFVAYVGFRSTELETVGATTATTTGSAPTESGSRWTSP